MPIPALSLSGAHLESRCLEETVPVLTDLLAFERLGGGPDAVVLRHPNTPWVMTVHEGGASAGEKFSTNHYGVRVVAKSEIDAAYAYLSAHAAEYGLSAVGEPFNQHGSYSVYFREPGTNTIEIECFEDIMRHPPSVARLGGVRGPHWEAPLPEWRFPGRGYVPQALTHGTLAMADTAISTRFYAEALGLEVHNAYGEGRVVYVKHPADRHYIVCIRGEERLVNSPNFRYTLSVASGAELEAAHRWLAERRDDFALSELHDIQTDGATASFLLRDPDLNWWEIAAGR